MEPMPTAAPAETSAPTGIWTIPETVSEAPARPGLKARLLALGERMLYGWAEHALPDKVIYPPVAPAEMLDPAEAAARIAKRGYARQAPRFLHQADDETRTNIFKHGSSWAEHTTTEHDGLAELRDFLQGAGSKFDANERGALSMLRNLTFIGEREYAEGAAGLAAYWKKLLDDDPKLQLCLYAGISEAEGAAKSDTFLRERVLGHFTNDEFSKYHGRLFLDPTKLTEDPKHVRILFIDDWTISGDQMHEVYTELPFRVREKYKHSIEINLLTASPARISRGLAMGWRSLPITAYFRAHKANGPVQWQDWFNNAYISGTHSTVDFDFGIRIGRMRRRISEVGRPALLGIVPPYHSGYRKYNAARLLLYAGDGDAP